MKKNANHAVVTISQRAAENKNSRVADFGKICLVRQKVGSNTWEQLLFIPRNCCEKYDLIITTNARHHHEGLRGEGGTRADYLGNFDWESHPLEGNSFPQSLQMVLVSLREAKVLKHYNTPGILLSSFILILMIYLSSRAFCLKSHQPLKALRQGPTVRSTGWDSAKSAFSIRASHTRTVLNLHSTCERPICVMVCALFTSGIALFSRTPT